MLLGPAAPEPPRRRPAAKATEDPRRRRDPAPEEEVTLLEADALSSDQFADRTESHAWAEAARAASGPAKARWSEDLDLPTAVGPDDDATLGRPVVDRRSTLAGSMPGPNSDPDLGDLRSWAGEMGPRTHLDLQQKQARAAARAETEAPRGGPPTSRTQPVRGGLTEETDEAPVVNRGTVKLPTYAAEPRPPITEKAKEAPAARLTQDPRFVTNSIAAKPPTGVRPMPKPVTSARPEPKPVTSARPEPKATRTPARPMDAVVPPESRPLVRPTSLVGEGDEPAPEQTALGDLADPLVSMRVHGLTPSPEPPRSETVAAPGELAGLVGASEMRRGLAAPLPLVQEVDLRAEKAAKLRITADSTDPEADASKIKVVKVGGSATPQGRGRAINEPTMALDLEVHQRSQTSIPMSDTAKLPMEPEIDDTRPVAQSDVDAARAALVRVEWTVAPLGRRSLAVAIDGVVVAGSVLGLAAVGVFGVAAGSLLDPDGVAVALAKGALWAPLVCLGSLALLFSTAAHTLLGRSLGKLAMGLRLVQTATGTKATLPRALLRAVLGLLGAVLAGMGYWWIIVDQKSRGWHDLLSGTVVVMNDSRRELLPHRRG